MILLNQNENPLGPSPHALSALHAAAPAAPRYAIDSPDLRARLLHHIRSLAQGNLPLDVIVGFGADHLLAAACYAALAHGGGEVIQPIFSYGQIKAVVTLLEQQNPNTCCVRTCPMTEQYEADLETMLRMITPRTRALCLTNPNNPTGLYFPAATLRAWLSRIPHDLIVVIDEAYIEFCGREASAVSLHLAAEFPHVLLIRSFSKIYGLAGLRLGYCIGQPQILARLNPWCYGLGEPGPPAQAAGIAALEDCHHLEQTRKLAETFRRQITETAVSCGGIILPSVTNFAMLRFSIPTERIVWALQQRGIIVESVHDPEEQTSWLRISMGNTRENELLFAALHAVVAGADFHAPAQSAFVTGMSEH